MAFLGVAFRVREHPFTEPADRVGYHKGGQFPAGEHIVPDGKLLIHQLLDEPLVHPLVVAADEQEVFLLRKLDRPSAA